MTMDNKPIPASEILEGNVPEEEPRHSAPGPERYGQFYWAIEMIDGEVIHVHADGVVIEHGMVQLLHGDPGGHELNLAINISQVRYVYAASVIDGTPVAVEHRDK